MSHLFKTRPPTFHSVPPPCQSVLWCECFCGHLRGNTTAIDATIPHWLIFYFLFFGCLQSTAKAKEIETFSNINMLTMPHHTGCLFVTCNLPQSCGHAATRLIVGFVVVAPTTPPCSDLKSQKQWWYPSYCSTQKQSSKENMLSSVPHQFIAWYLYYPPDYGRLSYRQKLAAQGSQFPFFYMFCTCFIYRGPTSYISEWVTRFSTVQPTTWYQGSRDLFTRCNKKLPKWISGKKYSRIVTKCGQELICNIKSSG